MEFLSYSDSELAEFAGKIVKSLTNNASFPNPPVPLADIGSLTTAFSDAVQVAMPGGIHLTAAKNAAREKLEDALRKTGTYVQTVANKDLQVLLTSGFYNGSTNRARAPLPKPAITAVENLATTQLLVRMEPVSNAKAYQLQLSANGNGGWQDAGVFTQSRRIVVPNLTPGTTYNVRARAVGGSTGYSEWSDAVARMAT